MLPCCLSWRRFIPELPEAYAPGRTKNVVRLANNLRIKRLRQKPLVRQSRTATIAATATVITIAVAAIATTTMTTISAIIEPAPIAATTAAYAAIISISTRRYISSKRELIA